MRSESTPNEESVSHASRIRKRRVSRTIALPKDDRRYLLNRIESLHCAVSGTVGPGRGSYGSRIAVFARAESQ